LGISLISEIAARKAENAGLVRITLIKDKEVEVPIYVLRRSNGSNKALNGFWEYLKRTSERFKGRLPCMIKMSVFGRYLSEYLQ